MNLQVAITNKEDTDYHRIMFFYQGLRHTIFGKKSEYVSSEYHLHEEIIQLINDRGISVEEIEIVSYQELCDKNN